MRLITHADGGYSILDVGMFGLARIHAGAGRPWPGAADRSGGVRAHSRRWDLALSRWCRRKTRWRGRFERGTPPFRVIRSDL